MVFGLTFFLPKSTRKTSKEYFKEVAMLGTILIIILILLLLGAIPAWPHSAGWGYGPSGLIGTILVILIILMLLGRL
jgi:hypothetical protein